MAVAARWMTARTVRHIGDMSVATRARRQVEVGKAKTKTIASVDGHNMGSQLPSSSPKQKFSVQVWYEYPNNKLTLILEGFSRKEFFGYQHAALAVGGPLILSKSSAKLLSLPREIP